MAQSKAKSSEKIRIGALEAGGTKMVMAVGTPDGRILEQEEIPTGAPGSTVEAVAQWFADKGIKALGIGAFGPTGVDPADEDTYGRILDTPKVAWRQFDFLGSLAQHLAEKGVSVPMGYDTDVNSSCLGEATFGSAQGLSSVVYLTVGTGIGAGVMVEGQLLHGMLHPEAGHISVTKDPNDPGRCLCEYHWSCLEGLAAGPSLEARWGKPAYELGENHKAWDLEAQYLADGLATYVFCYSPQRIILGGGVMKQTQLFPLIRQKLAEKLGGYLNTPELADMDTYVAEAGCGGDQGILGCIELGRRALEGEEA